jgi:hypothetical protein
MNIPLSAFSQSLIKQKVLIDILAFALVYFIPALAHLTGIPLFMVEPMRLGLILSIVHTTRVNSVILALTLPVFSYLVSGHPEFIKMVIITFELLLNTILFYWLLERIHRPFTAMILSILFSKIACYLAYWPVFSFAFLVSEAEPVFLLIQGATTLVFSTYTFIILKKAKP